MINGQPARVVHVVPALFGDGGVFGGAERYAFELARHMAKVTPTSLVSFSTRASSVRSSEGLTIRALGPAWHVRGQRTNPIHYDLVRVVGEADVVHCHQSHTLAAEVTAVVSRLRGRRVVTSDLGGGGWGFSAYLPVDRWFHAHLHISQYSRSVAGHGDNPRAAVIYGGVDVERFCPDASVPKEPLVVYVGRLLPHKGVNDLVEALPEGMSLELIGRPYHEQYFSDLKRLAVGKPVRFRTDCDDGELVRAYRRAASVVLPSVYRDCYGNETRIPELLGQTLLEGMACGTAAVCTDVASMPEVVEDGVSGFVVPPNSPAALGETLRRLRDHPDLQRDMGDAGRRRVLERFTWDGVVRHCLENYHG